MYDLWSYNYHGASGAGNAKADSCVGVEGIAPLAYQGEIQERGTIKGMTQGLRAFVTSLHLGCSHSSRGQQGSKRLFVSGSIK
jgi:hypothetical protein